MSVQFHEYQVKKLVNKARHIDGGWFWNKYSAYPYVGCAYGCAFCYQRMKNYSGRRDPALFDSVIKIKTNAVPLLRKELQKLPADIIALGDWQHLAEKRYRLSRSMLEVACEMGFPVFINERSDLIIEDLSLLVKVHRRSHVTVAFSFSHVDESLRKVFEPKSPPITNRLNAMRTLAEAGIQVGMALMPLLPYISDNPHQLQASIKAAADHGAGFVLAGGLTMADTQARVCLDAALHLDPDLEKKWRGLYAWPIDGQPSYGPPSAYMLPVLNQVKSLCEQYHLLDYIPRYIPPNPLAVNKRIAEKLFILLRRRELQGANPFQLWAYRKAAWAVDELETPLNDIYHQQGFAGLLSIKGISNSMSKLIKDWLENPSNDNNEKLLFI